MLVLFVNAHKDTIQGNTRFKIYHDYIHSLLKQSVCFGNEVQEIIRKKTEIQDFLYDETSYRCDQKAKEKFRSVQYIFIDGSTSIPPWSPSMKQVLLLIKMCIRANKKFHFNGSAHFGLYFYATTNFQKDYFIISEKAAKQSVTRPDYQFNEQTGDLFLNGKKVCHSGLKCMKFKPRPFSTKSSQALEKGIILPTKNHYMVFDSKNGNKILSNIRFPFTFYFKGQLFCTPKQMSQAKVTVLAQTQNNIPLAFTVGEGLSTHGLSPQFLKMISNWLFQTTGTTQRRKSKDFQQFKQIGVQNKFNYKKGLYQSINYGKSRMVSNKSLSKFKDSTIIANNQASIPLFSRVNSRAQTAKSRPQSSKYSKMGFQKPSLRCSGPYNTENQRYMEDLKASRTKLLGSGQLRNEGNIERYEIKNYVNQTPSRPPSAHKFRQVNKEKWIDKNTFFLS